MEVTTDDNDNADASEGALYPLFLCLLHGTKGSEKFRYHGDLVDDEIHVVPLTLLQFALVRVIFLDAEINAMVCIA